MNILKRLNFLTSFEHHTFSPFRIAVVDCQQRNLLSYLQLHWNSIFKIKRKNEYIR